jgi:tRNA pseudouridine38-40 synthase
MKYLLKLKYVGTGFCGFQVQPDKLTVQSALQDAIEKIYGERYDVKGCSRTDSGVHANVYYATFDLPQNSKIRIECNKLVLALNSVINDGIAILNATTVPDTFHVRHNVVSKEYVYVIADGQIRDPFDKDRVYFYPHTLTDEMIDKMNKAGELITGTKDFYCFMASGSSVSDTVRTVNYVRAERIGNHVHIYACADGFLYNMVRIIAGTLLDAARGKISETDIIRMIKERDRTLAGPTLPACGLYLNKLCFDKEYFNGSEVKK